MAINIKPSTHNQRKQIFLKNLLNKTSKVSLIAPDSILSGVGDGVSKVAGKAEKDIILEFTKLFPDNAFGSQLDEIAENFGIAGRFGASQSSTYIRIFGDVGTQYVAGIHNFKTDEGIEFELEETVTIGSFGFAYTKVRSIDTGSQTNIDPLSITTVSPEPTGHQYVINEYRATGGRDSEQDDVFRKRIKEGANLLATHTLAHLEQVFMKINPNVLRIFNHGIDKKGKIVIAIATQNGIDLNTAELDEILDAGSQYFALTELEKYGTKYRGITLKNIEWQPIDVSFRLELFPSYNKDEVRKNIQIKISKYLDFRFWRSGEQKVEWDDLLGLVKNTAGVKYVADQYFFPSVDIATDVNKMPRLRGFRMLDLKGNIIQDLQGNFNPVFYPNQSDFSFQQTALATI